MKCTDAKSVKSIVGIGALGAIMALFVGPVLAGSLSLGGSPSSIEFDDLGWAILVAVIATIAISVARLIGFLIARAAGTGPHLRILIGAALVIGSVAILMEYMTG